MRSLGAFFGDDGVADCTATVDLEVVKYACIDFVLCEAAVDGFVFRTLFAMNFLGSLSISRCFCSHSSTKSGRPSFTTVSGSHVFSGFRGSQGAFFLGPDVVCAISGGSSSGSTRSTTPSISSSTAAASSIAWTYSGLSSSSSMLRPTMSAGTAAMRSSGMPSLTKCILRSKIASLEEMVVIFCTRNKR